MAVYNPSPGGGTEPGNFFTSIVNSTVSDSGYYEAFFQPKQWPLGTLYQGVIDSLWKKAGAHPDKGPLMISRSTGGGISWTPAQVNVGGSLIQSYAHSHGISDDGTQIVVYQDDDTFQTVKWAKRTNWTANFVACGTITAPTGYTINPTPTKLIRMPEGQLRVGVYLVKNDGTISKGLLYELSSDFSIASLVSTVYDRATQCPASPYTDWMLNEFSICCIDDTGTNSTSKFICIARTALPNEGGTAYAYLTSTGGTTWTQSTTEDAGSFLDDNGTTQNGPFSRGLFQRFLTSNSPVSIAVYDGYVYAANGERNVANGFKLKFTRITTANAATNIFSNWEAPTTIETYHATVAGSTVDCGYPDLEVMFESDVDTLGKLVANHYDVSTLTRDPALTEDRCCGRQVIIAPLA